MILSLVCIILVFNQPPRLTQPGHPSAVGEISISESWRVNRQTVWRASPKSYFALLKTLLCCRSYETQTLPYYFRDSLGCKDLRQHIFTYLLFVLCSSDESDRHGGGLDSAEYESDSSDHLIVDERKASRPQLRPGSLKMRLPGKYLSLLWWWLNSGMK